MNCYRHDALMTSFFALIFINLILIGCDHESSAKTEVPISGDICHVIWPEGSHKTYFNIAVDKNFSGKLPDDVDSISISGPKGVLPVKKDDFDYNPLNRTFWFIQSGIPEIGEYRFKLVGKNLSGTSKDTQTSIIDIPVPDTRRLQPDGSIPYACKTSEFSWPLMAWAGPLYYQLQIRDFNRKEVYRTGFIKNLSSIRIPPDTLISGKSYQWRLRVADSPDWISMNNRSQTGWTGLFTAKQLKPCEYGYQVPMISESDWAASSLREEGIDEKRITEMMNLILDDEIPDIHSIILIKNGKLVLEEYFNGYSREVKHLTASVAKSITSILIGIALDKKLIKSIDENVYEFFPECKESGWIDKKYKITLKHVLTMTAGIDWDEISLLHPHPQNPNTQMYKAEHPICYVLDKKQIMPPGKTWRYSSGLTLLLGGILKYTSNLYADEFAGQYLFKPLGIDDYLWLRHPDGTVYTHGDLFIRPVDMAKIGCLMLSKGRWKNNPIVSRHWIQESTRKHVNTFKGYGYGYQWRIGTTSVSGTEVKGFWASGTGGQKIYVIPELNLVAVFTSRIFGNNSGHERNESLLSNFILPAVISPEYQPKFIKIDQSLLESVAGEYSINHEKILLPEELKSVKFRVFLQGENLFLKTPDGQTVQLFPESKDTFWITLKGIGQAKIAIIRDKNGRVKHARRIIGFRSILLDKLN